MKVVKIKVGGSKTLPFFYGLDAMEMIDIHHSKKPEGSPMTRKDHAYAYYACVVNGSEREGIKCPVTEQEFYELINTRAVSIKALEEALEKFTEEKK